jgi:hypothetical protein
MFGTNVMPQTVLPLGFQSKISISEDAQCDLTNCQITDNHQPWTILRGCGHSFHECCIDEYYCPICKQFLDEKVKDLGKLYKMVFSIQVPNQMVRKALIQKLTRIQLMILKRQAVWSNL